MRVNRAVRRPVPITHEGAPAYPHLTPIQKLRRSVMSTMLFEDTFYEDGQAIADRIAENAKQCTPEQVAATAVEARVEGKLRHVPLFLIDSMKQTGAGVPGLVSGAIKQIVTRPDDASELVAMHWAHGKKPLPKQYKKGLAAAFNQWDRYQLTKYANRDAAVKLRDVLFMIHAKPKDEIQAKDWRDLVDGQFKSADTWETRRSAGESVSSTYNDLLRRNKLGYLALLRNLRTMAADSEVDHSLVRDAIVARKGARQILPFQFLAAARHAPMFEPEIDKALIASIADLPKLDGYTAVCVDMSGSMRASLSNKSTMTRADAAATLAACMNGDQVRTWAFATSVAEVPHRKGMAGVDAIKSAYVGHGTNIGAAVEVVLKTNPDRIIVITDEQSHDQLPNLPQHVRGYFINTAPYANGVGYGQWTHIDGFSERVLHYMHELEKVSKAAA